MDERSDEEGRTTARVVGAVRRLGELAAERRAVALRKHGIDQGQLDVLDALAAAGDPFRLTAGELSRVCRVTGGAISQRLTVMERSGLVERVREEPDRRTVHVRVTAEGRAKLDEVADDVSDGDASVVQGLSERDLKAVERSLAPWLALHREQG